ncbi:ficolin-2-like [Ochlerotatus camptorhynchus]|uniref:ficolin-2-like n=1 Tax=Ochlerotatus camptorhynchus TaxID=644619 RepID=UPI0031DAAEED
MILKSVYFFLSLVVVESSLIEWTDGNFSTGDQTSSIVAELNDVNVLVFGSEAKSAPQSCSDVPYRRSGIHRIQPQFGFNDHFLALCDQEYSAGGWTVIQNRFDGSVNFYRSWSEYENGFGDLRAEFWLGLKRIHELTYTRRHELHILLQDFDGRTVVAQYSDFSVAGPAEKYKVNSVGTYKGDAGDSFSIVVNQTFSTLDADNDSLPTDNCAVMYKSGWWHKACHLSNLNGLYLPGARKEYATMLCWESFRGYNYGLKRSRMMIRPAS